MEALNTRYRGKQRPTDVLSFARADAGRVPFPEIGDVVVCWPVIVAQAKTHGVTTSEELSRMAVHGVLHLFGYDHERGGAEAQRMFRLQERIVQSLVTPGSPRSGPPRPRAAKGTRSPER